MRISIFDHGYANIISSGVIDWDELVDLCGTPEIGQKNGSYFVRGFCDGPRADANMRSTDLIIIDGDQIINNSLTCCNPQPVTDLLKSKNITHVIYSSYSNDLSINRHKWRLICPCPDVIDADTLRQGVEEIITRLHEAGLMVRNVRENLTLSQPWFFPRCSDEYHRDDFFFTYHDGVRWQLTGHIIPSATIHGGEAGKDSKSASAGCFSLEYVLAQFRAGTLHQGIKSMAGWYCRTTDWADIQIKQHISALVRQLCPDQTKVTRACDGKEIDNLIKYCRGKAGMGVEFAATWKDALTTAAILREKEFPPVRWAVDGLIPEGMTILAGDPKVGKSLLAVDICSSIAGGREAFGAKKCPQGVAVYLSMEDPERRVKARILSQCDEWPESFKLVTAGVPHIGPGFFDIFDEMGMLWPDIRSIIVDTMAFIMPPKKTGVQDYEHFYTHLHPVHDWAIKNHVAVVLITHLNKGKSAEGENPFGAIMGSQAIQGTADAMILLKKNHAKTGLIAADNDIHDGQLIITGREIGQEIINLEFEPYSLRWMFQGGYKPHEDIQGAQPLLICKTLETRPLTTTELSALCGLKQNTVRTVCHRLRSKNLLGRNTEDKWFLVGKDYQQGW